MVSLLASILSTSYSITTAICEPQLQACVLVCVQVGHAAAEATGGSMSTAELSGHTDSVVAVAFNAAGMMLAHMGGRLGSGADGELCILLTAKRAAALQ